MVKTKGRKSGGGKSSTAKSSKRRGTSTRKTKRNPSKAKKAAGIVKSATRAVSKGAKKIGKVARRKGCRPSKRNPGKGALIGKGLGGVAGAAALGAGSNMLPPVMQAVVGAAAAAVGVVLITMDKPIAGGVLAGAGGAVLGVGIHNHLNSAPEAPAPGPEVQGWGEDEGLTPGAEIIDQNGNIVRITDDGATRPVRALPAPQSALAGFEPSHALAR